MNTLVAVLIGVIIYQGIIHQLDKMEAVKREKELLDRVMSKDYAQFAQVKLTEKYYDKEPEAVQEEERGIIL